MADPWSPSTGVEMHRVWVPDSDSDVPPPSDEESDAGSDSGSRCMLCLAGHLVIRNAVWVVWLLLGFPGKLLESLFVANPVAYIQKICRDDPWGVTSGFAWGFIVSNTVFYGLNGSTLVSQRALCVSYLSWFAWCLAHLTVGVAWYSQVVRRLDVSQVCPALIDPETWWRVLFIGDGGYVGLVVGLSVAFPVAAFDRDHADATHPPTWCRLSDEVRTGVPNVCDECPVPFPCLLLLDPRYPRCCDDPSIV